MHVHMSYAKESTFLKALLEELNDVGACLGALDLALVFENGQARDCKVDLRLEFVGLEVVFSKKKIEFLSHAGAYSSDE